MTVASLTLAEVFGPGVVYLRRVSPSHHNRWQPHREVADANTGLQLAVAGGIPYVVCSGLVTPEALSILAEAGLGVEADLIRYGSIPEYYAVLSRVVGDGRRLACQRVHPEEEIPAAAAVVLPELLRSLNDKGKMLEVVRPEWLPQRRTLLVSDLPTGRSLVAPGRPVVLKVSTPLPSGGGHGVWIARTPEMVELVRPVLSAEAGVVVEEYLPLLRTVCVHAVVYPDGSSEVVGVAEEVCDDSRWVGNWLDAAGDHVPALVTQMVAEVVARASVKGYRGPVGIDVALCADGRVLVLDLNFRVCGSTTAVWLRPWVERTRGATTIRVATWTGSRGFGAMCRTVRAAMGRGTLIPLSLYDPEGAEMGGAPRLTGLVVGSSRAEVEEEVQRLTADGLGSADDRHRPEGVPHPKTAGSDMIKRCASPIP